MTPKPPTNGDKVSAKEFYLAQMKTNEKIGKYHSEVKVLIAEVTAMNRQIGINVNDIKSIRTSNKLWISASAFFAALAGVLFNR